MVVALDGKVYSPVGSCIYCGATDGLTKEHILPFGLSGTAILPQASCRRCAKITGAIEQVILRGPMWPVRVFRDLKSRTKHSDAPTHHPFKVIRQGREETLSLSVDDVPIVLLFPIFVPPRHWDRGDNDGGPTSGITLKQVIGVSFGNRPDVVARERGGDAFEINQTHRPAEFARMIAKIAYAFAYAEDQIKCIEAPFVVPSILGDRNDIGEWVGTTDTPWASHPGTLHRLELTHSRGFLCCEVQLFADSDTPSYGVILGMNRAGFVGGCLV